MLFSAVVTIQRATLSMLKGLDVFSGIMFSFLNTIIAPYCR